MNTPREYTVDVWWDQEQKIWIAQVKNEYGYELSKGNAWSYSGAQRWARGAIKRDLKRGDRTRKSSYTVRPGVEDLNANSDLYWAIATSTPAFLLSLALILYIILSAQ